MLRLLLAYAATAFGAAGTLAQHVPYPTYYGDGDELLRLELLAGDSAASQLALRPLGYSQVRELVERLEASGSHRSAADEAALRRTRARLGLLEARAAPDRGSPRAWLGRTFYRQPGYALALRRPGFELYANPVLGLAYGQQNNTPGPNLVVRNTRGVTVRGNVDRGVAFQTTIHENQARLPSWARDWRTAYADRVPGVGTYKPFSPLLWDAPDAVDYIQATADIGFRLTRHISLTAGHGNPRVGAGYRSAILDDFADPYLYARIDTRVWRLHYRNTFAELTEGVPNSSSVAKKFLASHTLAAKLTPAWEFGVTETTVLSRDGGFDAQYLNPVIFYRAVESDLGSPDNALIAAHTDLRLGRRGHVYGQILLDELLFGELLGGRGWWGNKFAWQAGGRWFDLAGVSGLEAQAEFNLTRPFTYAHRRTGIAFTHFAQPLAHPWGASAAEWTGSLSYRPTDRLRVSTRLVRSRQGDIAAPRVPNIGANVLADNGDRTRDFGYAVADTLPVERTWLRLRAEYLPAHGASVRLEYSYYEVARASGPNLPGQHGVTLGLYLNFARRSELF